MTEGSRTGDTSAADHVDAASTPGVDAGSGHRRDTSIPASIEYAWGLRDRPARGPRPGLSLEKIVSAAIAVAERDGIGAVSMSRVANEAGASTMSLYRYVAAKDELLALMVDTAIGPFTPEPEPAPEPDWRAGMARWAWAAFDGYRNHPWIVRLPITAPPITPNQISWMEAGLTALRGTGLTEQEKLSTILLLSGFAREQARMTADFTEATRAGVNPVELAASYGRTLARLVDPERFPAVHAAITSGSLDDEPDHTSEQFAVDEVTFGLDRMLDGIEVLIRSRLHPGGT